MMTGGNRIYAGGAILLMSLLIVACGETPPSDWPLYGRDYRNQRYSPLDQINTDTVADLAVAWRFQTGRKATFQTNPIVVDGSLFITTPFNDVIALDAERGDVLWRYVHKLRTDTVCCGPANRGAAVADGIIYTVTIDARLIALDQRTGEVLWDVAITDTDTGASETLAALIGVERFAQAVQTGASGYSASLAPQVYDGKVFVGITGTGYGLHVEIEESGEQRLSVGGFADGGRGLRGALIAYNAKTGEVIWRWHSVPETGWEGEWQETAANGRSLNRDIAAEKNRFTRYHDTWRYGGGSIWSTPAIDTELGLIYFGTGNPSPNMEDSTRPGDNLHTCSLVALEIDTGKLRWHYQQVPHDRWGYDVASPPVLFDYQHQGKTVKAVGQASKLGWFFIHDAKTGQLLKLSEPFIEQDNLFAPPSADGVRIVPGTLGAVSWSPVAYMPTSRTVFIAGIHQPSVFHSIQLDPTPDAPWESYTYFTAADEPDRGVLSALSVDTGKLLWKNTRDDPMVGGVLATAGGLIFSGDGNGDFNAFDARTGERLWSYTAPYGVNAPPISYAVKGKQYIAVAAGGNRLFGYKTGDELLVFALADHHTPRQ